MNDEQRTIYDEHVELLNAAVSVATRGAADRPRPGQALLSAAVMDAMVQRGHTIGAAPTGLGKSLAYLVPAGVAAIVDGERTVVSTEGLALQSQIVDKDLPSVSEAAEKVLGRPLRFAVHKGWANYGCALKATQVAEFFAPPASIRTVAQSRDALIEYGRKRGFLDETGNATGNIVGAPRPYDSDGDDLADSRIVPLAAWVLGTSVDGTPGDRRDIPETISDEPSWREWGALSVSSAECLGDECPFYGEECRPAAARRLVADADIVVTNHSMLAIQAAAAVPVIIGSNRIGPIRHVVIDEAHTLSSVVRDHGAIEMAGKSIISIIRGAERILNTVDPTVSALITEGRRLADDFDDALAAWARSHGKANPQARKRRRPARRESRTGPGVAPQTRNHPARHRSQRRNGQGPPGPPPARRPHRRVPGRPAARPSTPGRIRPLDRTVCGGKPDDQSVAGPGRLDAP